MNFLLKNIAEIKIYDKNPRLNDNAVKYVKESIKQFGFKVPIVIDKHGTIVAGHTRYKACLELGINEVPCIVADDLSEEQIKAFRLADNKVAEHSTWDLDLLSDELDDILDIDMSDFGFEIELEQVFNKKDSGALAEAFVVPPFSILDTRLGYWLDRRREWVDLGIKSEAGRQDDLLSGKSGGSGLKALAQKSGAKSLTGTSIFDPVLCEVVYKWFNVDGGKIFDPFAGGPARGIVAEKLNYPYVGIDLRKEQVQANIENAKELGVAPVWHCDDSLNADKYVDDDSIDLIFSCPPYFDLEVYSNDDRDLSNMDYEQFKTVYRQIIDVACRKLKENRFAVFVVGDVRDKKGVYRNFVDYTKQCFLENGLSNYNEIILINAIATASVRARSQMKTRKVTKIHQNVLVMYKGDPKRVKDYFNEIDVRLTDDED